MKVCRKGSRDTCSITTGATNHEDPLFAKRRREFIAHLPLGSYDTVFIDSNGADTWPAFVNIDADDALCPESFTDSDVKVMVPTLRTATAVQQSECASLIKNGNFQGSNTDPIFWLHNYGGIKLAPGKGIAGSNGAVGIEKSYLTTFLQFIDNRCIQVNVNQWYELKASIKLTNNDGSIFVCDAVKQTCPDIGLHTDIDGFTRVTYVSMQSLGNGFYSAQGFVQINARLAETSKDGMSLYVRSGVEGKLLTVDDVSTRLQVHTNYCKNLIRFGTMDDTSWKGLWVPNGPNLPAVISSISPGYNNSPTAMRTSKRSSSAEGPTYIGFRNIDMACMTPGSVWRIAVQVKLLDRATGKGASCNVNQRDDCPSFRISIRNGSGDRFFAEQYRTYAAGAANWNPDAFQKLQADFTLPPSATWDGRIKTIEFAIRDFPVDYDLIVDDVSLSPVV